MRYQAMMQPSRRRCGTGTCQTSHRKVASLSRPSIALPPKPEVISFDAAGTLVDVRWHPGAFAVECAREIGLRLDEQVAREHYERLLATRWREYQAINRMRDANLCDAFWDELAADWLSNFEAADRQSEIRKVAWERLYGQEQTIFRLYEDVAPTLAELKAAGFRMIVISNWDYSLHRVLANLRVHEVFEFVIASLEEGPEKPDRALFEIAAGRAGVSMDRMLHVGDHPVDDVYGAQQAGLQAILLDRAPETKKPAIASLTDLHEALAWLD